MHSKWIIKSWPPSYYGVDMKSGIGPHKLSVVAFPINV